MTAKLNDRARELVRALAIDGATNREIHAALGAGTHPLEAPLKVSLRTVQLHAAEARRSFRPETDPLADSSEVDAVDAIQRQLIRVAKRETDRLDELSKRGRLQGDQRRALLDWSRVLQEVRRSFRISRSEDETRRKGGDHKAREAAGAPVSVLDQLAAQLADEAAPSPPTPPQPIAVAEHVEDSEHATPPRDDETDSATPPAPAA